MNFAKLLFSLFLFVVPLCATVDHRIIPVTTIQPDHNKVYPIAVIGSGAAGVMAAKRAILNNDTVLLFTGARPEMRNSRGTWVRKVDNIPGLESYERTLLQLRNETLTDLLNTPFRNNLYIIENSVASIERQGNVFKLKDPEGNVTYAKYVVLATGIMNEQPEINGSIRPILSFANQQTVGYCLMCDGHHSFQKRVAIIGDDDLAANGAVLLSKKYEPKKITILTNGRHPAFSPECEKKLQERKIPVVTQAIIDVLDNGSKGQLAGFQLENGWRVDADMGYVMLGIRPNNQLVKQLGAKVDERGLVIADAKGETSIPNLFVAGDLRSGTMKQIYTAWQHGVDAAQEINRRIRLSRVDF